MHVVIEGVRFVPAGSTAKPKIGVAISSHNRHDILSDTISAFEKCSPGIPIIVVDDGSEPPIADSRVTVVRHDTARGIPAAKNRCLAELMALGVDHLFLFDDDTRPADEEWWKPYVDGVEPHYSYCWTKFAKNNQPVPKMDVVYEDDGLVAYGWSMGCMLYVHSSVVQRVGGMRPEFGMGMEEHCEWSQRIHNAGCTTFVHQDVPNSSKLIWAADEFGAVTRSFDWRDRNALLAKNEKLRLACQYDDSFVEYRAHRDVVLTSYFTSQPDPQRNGQHAATNTAVLDRLLESTPAIVLHDGLELHTENYCVPTPLPAYQQRWISEWQWLRSHPDVNYVWLVDATDVVMLNDPFPHMQRDTLYTGWENQIVGCPWMREHSASVSDWVEANAQQMLLNCGLIGGDRDTVMRLCRRMIDLWAASKTKDPLEEMIFMNIAAREHERLVTGRQVCTLFKANITSDDTSWWAHK